MSIEQSDLLLHNVYYSNRSHIQVYQRIWRDSFCYATLGTNKKSKYGISVIIGVQ